MDLLAGTSDPVTKDGRREVTYRIDPHHRRLAGGRPRNPRVDRHPYDALDPGRRRVLQQARPPRRRRSVRRHVAAPRRRTRRIRRRSPHSACARPARRSRPASWSAMRPEARQPRSSDPRPWSCSTRSWRSPDRTRASTSWRRRSSRSCATRPTSTTAPDIVGTGVKCGALSRVECFATSSSRASAAGTRPRWPR